MIKVAVAGCAGRMGTAVSDAVRAAEDLELVCGVDPQGEGGGDVPVFASVPEALAGADFDVLVDFTQPAVVEANLRAALPAGVAGVVGPTGLSHETRDELAAIAPTGTCLFYAPNFTTGAVLMMQFAKAAAPYFPEAEVLEFHHARKLDAPSGTAVRTAQIIAEARGHRASEAPGRETEILAMLARGRSAPFIAQELVISPNTVKTHVKHIYAKLGAHSQQEIIDLVDGQCAAE